MISNINHQSLFWLCAICAIPTTLSTTHHTCSAEGARVHDTKQCLYPPVSPLPPSSQCTAPAAWCQLSSPACTPPSPPTSWEERASAASCGLSGTQLLVTQNNTQTYSEQTLLLISPLFCLGESDQECPQWRGQHPEQRGLHVGVPGWGGEGDLNTS